MARPKLNDDASAFAEWARAEHGITAATALVYASSLRTALTELGPEITNTEAVLAYFERLKEQNPSKYQHTARPWRLFREWAQEFKDEVYPELPKANPGRPGRRPAPDGNSNDASNQASQETDSGVELPEPVRQAIFGMRQAKIPMACIAQLLWGDLRVFSGTCYVYDPRSRSVLVPIGPASLQDGLREYAQPTGLMNPLIPSEPGGSEPIRMSQLRRVVAVKRKAVDTQIVPRAWMSDSVLPPADLGSVVLPTVPAAEDETPMLEDDSLAVVLGFNPNED